MFIWKSLFLEYTNFPNESNYNCFESCCNSFLNNIFKNRIDTRKPPTRRQYELIYYILLASEAVPQAVLDKLSLLSARSPEGVRERFHIINNEKLSLGEFVQDLVDSGITNVSNWWLFLRLSTSTPPPRAYSIANFCPAHFATCKTGITLLRGDSLHKIYPLLTTGPQYRYYKPSELLYNLKRRFTLANHPNIIQIAIKESISLRGTRPYCKGLVSTAVGSWQIGDKIDSALRKESASNILLAEESLLLGTGTGVAPLRSVLQTREHMFDESKTKYVVGFRTNDDIVFPNTFNSSDVVLSREDPTARKKYISDRITECHLGSIVKSGASIMLGGSSHPMPAEVIASFWSDMYNEPASILDSRVLEWRKKIESEGRYCAHTWS